MVDQFRATPNLQKPIEVIGVLGVPQKSSEFCRVLFNALTYLEVKRSTNFIFKLAGSFYTLKNFERRAPSVSVRVRRKNWIELTLEIMV